MAKWLAAVCTLCLAMLLPYLPGRFDASASGVSLLAQVATFASALFIPVGIAWRMNPCRARLWGRLALGIAAFIGLATVIAGAAIRHLSLGLLLGGGIVAFLRWARLRMHAVEPEPRSALATLPVYLVVLPTLLIGFRVALVPRAAEWSRDRAIRHSAPLIAEIESFRARRGHYPESLQSLNRDIPTGVIGLERFLYEPNGASYNLYFIRPHTQLDAMEVVLFNPHDEHRFTSHELDLLHYQGEELELRRGDRRRTALGHPQWISILFD